MSIRYIFLLLFLSSLVLLSFFSRCSADGEICQGHNSDYCSVYQNFSGILSFGNFSNADSIKFLNLSHNNFTGIDDDFWDKGWTSLTQLDLSFNEINHTLPKEISKLKSLETLNLSTNNFSSEIPIDKIDLPKLSVLDLSANQFNWSIDKIDLPKLSVLDLSANQISWSNSLLTGKLLKTLTVLNLANNYVPLDFSDIASSSNLARLNLSSTGLWGSIPQSISGLSNLIFLDLSNNNNLTGPIISNLSKIKSLEYLNLKGVNLDSETNLSSIGNLTNLTYLNLCNTNLSLAIPTEITNLQNLSELDLSDNKLIGGLPRFDLLANLEKLNLSFNNLNEQIPDLTVMRNLSELDLSHNKLTGPIPDFSNMTGLKVLNLSSNNLKRQNLDFSNMTGLTVLDLSHNNLTGQIQDFSKMKGVTVLDLSSNNLEGPIPDFSNMTVLTVLDLSRNNLKGPIPDFSNMKDLMVLNLSDNHLSGSISEAMEKKMQNMSMVNISNNKNLTSCSTNLTFLSFYEIRKGNSCGVGTFPEPRKSKTTIVLAVVLPIVFLIVIFAFLIFAYRRRRKLWALKLLRFSGDCSNQGGPYKFQTDAKEWVVDVKLPTTVPVLIFDRPLTKISFADLLIATSNFSRQSLLAEENSGLVYAGYLPEGHPVAIKVLVDGLSLSDQEVADELERLAQIKHQNLVQLLGYCFAGRQRIVIYDYNMQNGTLRDLLHKVSDYREHGKNFSLEDEKYEVEEMANDGQVQNTWEFRHKIALGVARGLGFLHHGSSPSIIHGLVRAHSVLLDSNLEPRLSDYALYRLTSIKFQDDNPYGSPGYMAEATAESDVYDFGILLFELLTGKQTSDDQNPGLTADNNLVKWVRGLSKKDMLSEAIDAKIRGTGPEKQMEEALKIGYLCTADIPSKRPSMKQVIGLLKDIEPNVEKNGK